MLLFLFILDSEDVTKLERIYYNYKDEMYRKAYYFMKDKELSMDVIQTSIIKLSKHLDKINDVYSKESRAYILTIVKHVCLNILRKKQIVINI